MPREMEFSAEAEMQKKQETIHKARSFRSGRQNRTWGNQIRHTIQVSLRAKPGLLTEGRVEALSEVAHAIVEVFRRGGKLLVFGNGDSAANAQHFATELVRKYYRDRQPLPALALTVNTSSLTAVGNDYSFQQIFARQVEAQGQTGDVAIGISTSGNSPNVIEGLKRVKQEGLVTVGLTGATAGRLKELTDYCLCAPSTDTPRIQEGHILMADVLSEIVEQELFPTPKE